MGMVAERLQAATANLMPPFAVVDLDALDDNAKSMITRAHGLPIRLATKSIRCRAVTNRVLERSEFRGVLAYSLAEAIWLARSGIPDSGTPWSSPAATALPGHRAGHANRSPGFRAACASSEPKRPARCKRHSAAGPQHRYKLAIASGFGTPRLANSANDLTVCIS